MRTFQLLQKLDNNESSNTLMFLFVGLNRVLIFSNTIHLFGGMA